MRCPGIWPRIGVCCWLLLAGLTRLAAGEGPDLARLSRRLDHDDFATREQAERELTRIGRAAVKTSFDGAKPPPEVRPGADLTDYFDELAAQAQADVRRALYDRMTRQLELEGQIRLERIRHTLDNDIAERLNALRAKYPQKLAEGQTSLYQGYTGGFRDAQQKWFDASYHNHSQDSAVTAVLVRIRLIHRGKKTEQEVLLQSGAKPILPRGSGTLSAEVELPRGATYDFVWQTAAVYGYPVRPGK